ncbi:MAG: acylneuraminate cytidylyltransferase family protein [Pseudodesulfovibrio sp.]|nr:acylneuraminate cytidylyltransferase family protein [Pseudodesulfovibrio sp.]
MKIFGFIFARGGSKGLPGKNIKKLGGIPLISHAINAGKASGLLDRIIVSTDDPDIAEIAQSCGAEVPFMRPQELGQDTSPEWLAWRHAIEQVDDFDIFVSIPATSPLRSGEDIKSCVNLYLEGDCDMVVTTRAAERHPSFNMVKLDSEGYASVAMPLDSPVTRRQDAPVVYDMTTVAYVTSPEFIMNNDGVFSGRVKAVEIPPERAVDIDTQFDFDFAQFIMERQ